MVPVKKELHDALMERGKLSAFVSACEKIEADGEKNKDAIRDRAIGMVCPDLDEFRKVKTWRTGGVDDEIESRSDSSCNGFRMLEWVVENFEYKKAKAKDAPSRASWSILLAARRDEDTYRDVLKKFMDAKLKLDIRQGDTETRRLDGQTEYDILENLDIEV